MLGLGYARRLHKALFITIILGSLWACGLAEATASPSVRNISYGPHPQEILDICRPPESTGLHPCLIMIHGGAWVRGDKKGLLSNWCQQFAKKGFVVATMDYRLANEQGPTSNWPAFQIGDVQLAIRWMRAHAAELHLDPSRLCAYGTSAGAYLAVFAGTLQTIAPSDVASINPEIPVKLSCVAEAFGPVDLTDTQYAKNRFVKFIGSSYEQNPDVYEKDSPLLHVTHDMPPTLVLHGTHDSLVPISQSDNLVRKLKDNNVPVQFITYDGDHAYKGLSPQERENIFQQIAKFLNGVIGPERD